MKDLEKRIAELEKKLEDHRHLGVDGSRELDDNTKIGCKEISVSGVGLQKHEFAIPYFRAYDVDDMGKDRRKMSMALGVSGDKGEYNEQNNMVFQVGKGEIRQQSSREDWDKNNFAQIVMSHQLKDIPEYLWWTGKKMTAATYLFAKRSPIIFGTGVISGNKLTDESANFKTGLSASVTGAWSNTTTYYPGQIATHNEASYECIQQHDGEEPPNATYWKEIAYIGHTRAYDGEDLRNTLVHAVCNIKTEALAIQEANVVLEAREKELIFEKEWNWDAPEGNVNYEIHMPVIFGSASSPYSLGYFGDGLIFGYGTRGNNNISSLTWGEGTPEGRILANVGSMYLRQDGGAGTTFYIKETGKNSTTGWVAK
jgi:hypothetical protein